MGKKLELKASKLGDVKVLIWPPDWPSRKIRMRPGNFGNFAPMGSGMRGFQRRKGSDPVKNSPRQEPSGGSIYFASDIKETDFNALMRVMEVEEVYRKPLKEYAAFMAHSVNPEKNGFISQLRIISNSGMQRVFDALTDDEFVSFPVQEVTAQRAMWYFIQQERKHWGTSALLNDGESSLFGSLGGDGLKTTEELSFGLMVENYYHRIYRVWSRPWLISK